MFLWELDFEMSFAILNVCFGSIAQSVEQRTLNPWVAGSIPARPTITTKKGCLVWQSFLCLSLTLCRAAWAIADIKNADIQILHTNIFEMFFAHVSMNNGVILVGSRHYLNSTERTISESNMFGCRIFALAPAARNVMVLVHECLRETLSLCFSDSKKRGSARAAGPRFRSKNLCGS